MQAPAPAPALAPALPVFDVRTPITYRLSDLPLAEQPGQRLREHGPTVLTTAELLALLWPGDTADENALQRAQRTLTSAGGLHQLASGYHRPISGLGPGRSTQLTVAVELGRRVTTAASAQPPIIRSPADVAALLLLEMSLLDYETIRVVLLDTKNRVHSMPLVYRGTLNSSPVRTGELFRDAVRYQCASIVLVHNHPSGNPTPSAEDVQVTSQARSAGKLLDIELLDHVIIGDGKWVSLKERGIGFQ